MKRLKKVLLILFFVLTLGISVNLFAADNDYVPVDGSGYIPEEEYNLFDLMSSNYNYLICVYAQEDSAVYNAYILYDLAQGKVKNLNVYIDVVYQLNNLGHRINPNINSFYFVNAIVSSNNILNIYSHTELDTVLLNKLNQNGLYNYTTGAFNQRAYEFSDFGDSAYTLGVIDGASGLYSGDELEAAEQAGYIRGKKEVEHDFNNFGDLFFSILDAPFNIIRNMLNFEVFGINISSLVFFLLSIALVGWIIRRLT